MLPAVAFLILFLAYPLGLGVWLSFTDARSAAPACSSASRTTNGCGTTSIFWLSVFNTLLYTIVASAIKFAVGLYLALLLNENLPFKAMHPRRRADPVHRADRAVGDRVLVDLRQRSSRSSPGRCSKLGLITDNINFLGDHLERALVGDLRQYLARRAVRRDHAAGRPADRVAVALRGRDHRRRQPAGSGSATSPIRCSRRSSPW